MRPELAKKRKSLEILREGVRQLETACENRRLDAREVDKLTEPMWRQQLELYEEIVSNPAVAVDEVIWKLELVREWHASDQPELDCGMDAIITDLRRILGVAHISQIATE